jgi:hypothetical protein
MNKNNRILLSKEGKLWYSISLSARSIVQVRARKLVWTTVSLSDWLLSLLHTSSNLRTWPLLNFSLISSTLSPLLLKRHFACLYTEFSIFLCVLLTVFGPKTVETSWKIPDRKRSKLKNNSWFLISRCGQGHFCEKKFRFISEGKDWVFGDLEEYQTGLAKYSQPAAVTFELLRNRLEV